jgi:HEAT repeat protein
MVPALVAALDKEQAEFVRPSLVRALAAQGDDLRVRPPLLRDVGRGQDFFRSAVIEALGDYKAQYALEAVTAIAKLDGPLQDDAALALGKFGDRRALETLAGLQRTAPRRAQPSIAAAICLLGVNCKSHESFLVETLEFAGKNGGFQDLLRASTAGLGALGVAGHAEAVEALFQIGIPAEDDAIRAPVALALGAVALRNTALIMPMLQQHPKQDQAIGLVADGFDMLEEDLDKERFFAFARRTFWEAPEGSPTRALMQTLIGKLDF